MRQSILRKNKSNRVNQIILGVFLVLIMLFSTAGYAFRSDTTEEIQKINYNGFEFESQGGYWTTTLSNLEFHFYYNPREVEQVASEVHLLNSYRNKPLYIYSENIESTSEIYRNLFYGTGVVQRMQSACLQEKCDENSPIKTCEDNFILITEGDTTKITQQDNCVFIEGKGEDLVKITDEFLFKILGIN